MSLKEAGNCFTGVTEIQAARKSCSLREFCLREDCGIEGCIGSDAS